MSVRPTEQYDNGDRIDADGLPYPGAVIHPSEPYISSVDCRTNRFTTYRLKGEETAIVDQANHACTVSGRQALLGDCCGQPEEVFEQRKHPHADLQESDDW